MRRLASLSHDRRRVIVAVWIAAIAAALALAAGAGGGYVNNFTLPGTESQRALDLLNTLLFDRQADKLDKADVQRVVTAAQAGATRGLQVELGGQAIQRAEQTSTGP